MSNAALEEATQRKRLKTSTRNLTTNDNKILGQNTERKKEVVNASEKYTTLKMKTHNSAWTPVVHKASNQQVSTVTFRCTFIILIINLSSL